jgi:hypothetical protein
MVVGNSGQTIHASPMSYAVDGVQYVALAAEAMLSASRSLINQQSHDRAGRSRVPKSWDLARSPYGIHHVETLYDHRTIPRTCL